MAEFKNKTVLITGASRGIGEAASRLYAEAGANVVMMARSGDRIAAIAEEIGVNLAGPAYVCRRALRPLYAEGRRGDFVFISSDAKRWPRPHQSIYTATKAGLEGLAAALALEFEGTGLRSTVIRVGPAMSEYAADWSESLIAQLLKRWQHFGLQRHLAMMPGEAIARAVVTAVTTPEGVRVDTLEVQPEAPRED